MSTETPSKEKVIPKLVKLENALKLAEGWVNNMSGSAEDETSELEFEARPPRLGLGAKVIRQSNMGASTDPIERRLRAKLEAGKKRANKNKEEESNPSERNDGHDSDDDDDEPESRTNAFTKKRPVFLSPSSQNKKKRK
ncbi:Protein of unknown function DUF3245 [Macleaya cordata]|uniref:Uncharacterized protein n=1 Tax=Macleaya cordata TaxID=56857 RepID=A0A200QUB0_MACCD|nr:Protein of unknown function DUF3245 [Macleaya cordata]